MATLYQDLEARGIVKQVTSPELASALERGPITLYAGFDPTSDALHVGSLLPLLTLRRFQLAGHKPLALVGGATGMIGDPSGKTAERSLQGEDQVKKNLAGIRKVIEKFLSFEGPNAAVVVNNGDWFKEISFIGFLRDVGKHFTVNHMMAKESVRARLEDRDHGISYTEFSYMLLQAYDYKFLHDKHGCSLQIGGSDQWGNITAGIELIRRMKAAQHGAHCELLGAPGTEASEEKVDTFGLTHPLVSKADGTKFGKSESGTIWLDPTKTSPYRFYQFFIQTQDADVMTFLHYFTFLSHERLAELDQSLKTEPEKRLAQTTLAAEVTRLVHGDAELQRAEAASKALFGTEIRELDEATLLDVLSGAPATHKPRATIHSGKPPANPAAALTTAVEGQVSNSPAGLTWVDLLVETALCPSKGQARKDLAAGGIYVNNERLSDANGVVKETDLIAGRHLVLRKGKKNYHLVSFD